MARTWLWIFLNSWIIFEIRRAHIVGYSMGARLSGSPPRPGMDEQRVKEVSAYLRKRSLNTQNSSLQDYVALEARLRASRTREVPTYQQLGAVDVPVLAIVGSEDSEANIEGLKATKSVLPSLELVVIDGATHSRERGAVSRSEFLRSLKAFIASHSVKNYGAYRFDVAEPLAESAYDVD